MLSQQAASGLRGVVHVNGSLAALPQRQSSLLHRGRRSVVERQLPKLTRLPVTKAMIYRNLDRTTWENGYIESFNARLRDELLNVRFSTPR